MGRCGLMQMEQNDKEPFIYPFPLGSLFQQTPRSVDDTLAGNYFVQSPVTCTITGHALPGTQSPLILSLYTERGKELAKPHLLFCCRIIPAPVLHESFLEFSEVLTALHPQVLFVWVALVLSSSQLALLTHNRRSVLLPVLLHKFGGMRKIANPLPHCVYFESPGIWCNLMDLIQVMEVHSKVKWFLSCQTNGLFLVFF